jgi:Ca2+/Na+ antiporter
MGIIDSSYENLEVSQLLPSFFEWAFGGALNQGDGSLFGVGLISLIAVSSFLMFKGFRYEKAMITSAMITFITGLLSLSAGWIGAGIFTFVCIYFVIALYYLFKKSSGEEA